MRKEVGSQMVSSIDSENSLKSVPNRKDSKYEDRFPVALATGCLAYGIGLGLVAKEKPPGMELIRGKPAKEAGLAALQEAEKLAAVAPGSGWVSLACITSQVTRPKARL